MTSSIHNNAILRQKTTDWQLKFMLSRNREEFTVTFSSKILPPPSCVMWWNTGHILDDKQLSSTYRFRSSTHSNRWEFGMVSRTIFADDYTLTFDIPAIIPGWAKEKGPSTLSLWTASSFTCFQAPPISFVSSSMSSSIITFGGPTGKKKKRVGFHSFYVFLQRNYSNITIIL